MTRDEFFDAVSALIRSRSPLDSFYVADTAGDIANLFAEVTRCPVCNGTGKDLDREGKETGLWCIECDATGSRLR